MADLDELVPAVVPRLLGALLDGPPSQVHGGYASSAWLVGVEGVPLLVKVSHAGAPVDKAVAASSALRLAATTSAPVPREVFFDPECGQLLGRVVRILTWLDGEVARDRLDQQGAEGFFTELGSVVASLHQARCDAFTTRLGGAPAFDTWAEFVRHRSDQIRERVRRTGAIATDQLETALSRALAVAIEVSPVVEPRLAHRDLHLDNVLVTSSGHVAGVLDLDGAGAWDPAVDLVKLRAQVFPHHPGSEQWFTRGYASTSCGLPEQLDRRVAVVEVLELTNAVANAGLHHNDVMVEVNRRRLTEVLSSPW
ncbi:phosphotransferase family protein [Auraticoccus monumenti]|uniref:Predicted kinase, aminoglycoside phosphotransferase (APT) family n=1 Tax=Auraticoccus monumenti TaxID=675864 RepID=A0A1G7CWC2_9ACTN|nr:aminoglycoside phosphotransferase family protein [Auraticoccus monumenti]SDE43599.1 Predicted kinase, aminoglycoside phosphotransferase (APT) family [Auraticoccus monumenti]